MRILHLGDTHLGIQRRFWRPPVGWSRADDHLAALRRALAPAFAGEVDLVVHAGDVFDRSRPPPRAVAEARALLVDLSRRVPVLVLAGNHDRRGLQVHLGAGAGTLTVVDRPCAVSIAGLRIACVPHQRLATDWAATARAAVGGGVDLMVTHQAFAGAEVPGFVFRVGGPSETVDERHLPDGVLAVLNGHIHPRQVLRCGDADVVYPGSTERTSFSESGQQKGTALWTWGTRPRWRWVDHPTRGMRRVVGEHELDRVVPGELVGVPTPRLKDWGPAVHARGGILALPPARSRAPDRRQLRLFQGPPSGAVVHGGSGAWVSETPSLPSAAGTPC